MLRLTGRERMIEKVKFVTVTRVIDDRKGIHYFDAIDENGRIVLDNNDLLQLAEELKQ